MKFSILPFAAALMSVLPVLAQTETARQVRFLALGELPPFHQEIRDGVRYELEPPAGSIPPRELMLGFGTESSESLPLRLGEISAPMKAPAGAGPLLLSRSRDAKDAEPWLRVNRPESGDFLVLLWRDSKKGTWDSTRSLVVPDDAVSAPAGSVRFANVSPAAGVVLLNPGERSLVSIYLADGAARRLPLKVAVKREIAPVAVKKE